jgi:hypothetical protein
MSLESSAQSGISPPKPACSRCSFAGELIQNGTEGLRLCSLTPDRTPQDPGFLPLDPATIRALRSTIQQSPRPLLQALTQGSRKRFSIPEEATTIADRILQKRHHDWIEAFLD